MKRIWTRAVQAVRVAAPAAAAAICLTATVVPAEAAPEGIRVYVGSGYEYQWAEEAGKELATGCYPQLALNTETKEEYPLLAEAFDTWNKEKKSQAEEAFAEVTEAAEEMLKEIPDMFSSFSNEERAYIQRADTSVVSVLSCYSGYMGGAHGYYGYRTVNFNPASGAQYALSDLVSDPEAFMQCVKETLYAEHDELEKDLTESYFSETAPDEMIWTAGPRGITCYFDPYTLGPYAIGSQKAEISYAEHPELFTEEIRDVPENYGVELPAFETSVIDGRTISLYGNASEYDGYDSVTVSVDGEETTDEVYTYSFSPTLLHWQGQDYLYVELYEDNDYRDILVYNLLGKPVKTADTGYGHSSYYDQDAGFSYSAALTDPGNMPLSVRTGLLGTSSGERFYKVGLNGIPDPLELYYRFTWPRTLTLKEDFKFDEVDEAGNTIGEADVPAGTEMAMTRTDDQSFVDLSFDEGRLARAYVTAESWPQTVNGRDIEEIFDGVVFAG